MSDRPQTIFRIAKNKDNPYVMIDKRPLENPSLSWKAKGLLAYLLSRPDDWEIIIGDLIKRSTDGESAVRSAIKELTAVGHIQYIGRERLSGTYRRAIWAVFEVPQPDGENRYQVSPNGEKPNWEKPNWENHPLNNKDSNDKESTKDDFSKTLEQDRQCIVESEDKRGDPIEGWMNALRMQPGVKKSTRLEEIHELFCAILDTRVSFNKWESFYRFVDEQEQTKGRHLHVFMRYLLDDDNFSMKFWNPNKMIEAYPEAFPVNNPNNPEIGPDGGMYV